MTRRRCPSTIAYGASREATRPARSFFLLAPPPPAGEDRQGRLSAPKPPFLIGVKLPHKTVGCVPATAPAA